MCVPLYNSLIRSRVSLALSGFKLTNFHPFLAFAVQARRSVVAIERVTKRACGCCKVLRTLITPLLLYICCKSL